jgi:hypothetical protein
MCIILFLVFGFLSFLGNEEKREEDMGANRNRRA